MNTVFFLGETINGENPTTSSEKESDTKIENPKIVSDLPTTVILFLTSPNVFSFLTYALHLSVFMMCAK